MPVPEHGCRHVEPVVGGHVRGPGQLAEFQHPGDPLLAKDDEPLQWRSAGATNQKLAEAIQLNAPEQVEVLIHDSLGNIPFYNEDIDVEGQVPAAAAALRAAANDADTLLLVTPEHNGTVPASLKNAIDWLSRPFGAGALSGKPTAVVGTAFGQFGGVWAQDEARKAVGIAGARVIGDVKLAVPGSMVRFAEVHPKDDAEIVEQIKAVFEALEESRTASAA